MSKIFAVGDIHGRLDKLDRLLERLPVREERDALVFLGDYVNRGPRSREVLDRLLEVERRFPRAEFLLGNHEHALLEYSRGHDVELFRLMRRMGVEATLESYGAEPAALADLSFLPAEHRAFLERLKPYVRLEGYLFVHAGVPSGETVESCPLETLLTTRTLGADCRADVSETIVFGHTPFDTPLVAPGLIGVDTGAAYGGPLTAVELPDLRFFHA